MRLRILAQAPTTLTALVALFAIARFAALVHTRTPAMITFHAYKYHPDEPLPIISMKLSAKPRASQPEPVI